LSEQGRWVEKALDPKNPRASASCKSGRQRFGLGGQVARALGAHEIEAFLLNPAKVRANSKDPINRSASIVGIALKNR
jgi:hypothetical protein